MMWHENTICKIEHKCKIKQDCDRREGGKEIRGQRRKDIMAIAPNSEYQQYF
jgi:hypothetical protein